MAFDMGIACINCNKENVLTFEKVEEGLGILIGSTILGTEIYEWHGTANCRCGWKTFATMTVNYEKNGGGNAGN